MRKLLPLSALILMSCFLCSNLEAQNSKSKKTLDYLDPNENFYVTQARINKYYKKFEKEIAEEREERADKMAKTNKSGTVIKGTNNGAGITYGREEEEELAGYELYKRWESYMAPRVYPSGDKTLASKAYEEYLKYINDESKGGSSANNSQKAGNPNSIMSTTWAPIGPFGDLSGANAGRVNAIRFDPTNPNGYWACAPDGGLWSTTNTGSTWNTNTDALSAIGSSDVVWDPTNSQNMWMASGDGDAGDCYSLGVLKSTNGGVSWSATGLAWTVSQGRRIYKLLINPLNKNTIFAATTVGLYRTQNGGTSWTAVIGAGSVTDIEYKPGDTTTVYAVTTQFWRSTNGGTTWTNITTGLPTSASTERFAIAVTPGNANYVYVVASSAANSGFLAFCQSTNSGASFTNIATTTNLLGWASAGNDTGGQGWYTLSIAASPTNPSEVCVGGVNIWRTTNAGTSWGLFAHWTGTGAPYVHADIHDLIYKNGTSIYASCDGGAFQTTNSGGTWFSMNGNMNIAQIYKIGLSTTTYSRAITGHQDNGTNVFTGGWAGSMGGDGMSCFIDRTNDNVMYGEQYQGSFNRTTNGGASWTGITTGLTGTAAWNTPWHQDPSVANTIYGGYSQLFKSTNQGTSWTQIGTMGGSGSVVEFAVAPSNNQVIYVIRGNALYKTTNGGGTWTAITGTLPVGSAQLTWVAVEDVDPNSVWVTFSGYSAGNKVFQSVNGGTTWTNISGGLPNLPANCILYQNATQDGMYVGCDVGVYYKDSTMANWVNYSTGLPNVKIADLQAFYPLGKLRAATYGRSVYEVDLFNPGTLAPIANFTSNQQVICPGMTINFTDLSTFGPTSWSWVFQSGTPASSTSQNPAVVYNTPGTYSVQLTATNSNGSSVMTKTLYITVSPTNTLPLVEGFTAATFPPPNWQNYDHTSDSKVWTRNAGVGKPAASLFYDNYNVDASNTRDEMRAPKYSFVGYTNVKCYFDVAYARYDATYSDSLAVLVSTDCGQTYTQLYLKGGTTLATAPDKTVSIFSPTAAQWRTDTVYLNAYSGMSNVMVSFQNRGRYGQALYIDNVNIAGTVVSMPPTAAFTYTAGSPCSGQAINFSDASTNSPTSWNWSFPGGVPATSSVKNPTVTYASAGTYTVTLTSTNGAGPSSPVTQTITVNPTPTVSANTASVTICNGQTVLLTGSGATTYSWNTGASTNTTNVSPVANTTYTVTGTTGGCSSNAMVSVTVNATPTVAVNTATACSGSAASLTASGATTYTWNTGATSAAISVTPAVTTVYTVTGTTGGCTNAKTTTVTVSSNPTVAVNSTSVCSGSSANITASGASTYTWNTGATTAGISVSPIVTTVYTVTGTTGGCTNTKTSTVTAIALPTVTANNATVCAGSNANITAAGAGTYTWNTGATTAGISVSPTVTTTYTVTGTSGAGCNNSTTAVVNVNALPSVTSNTSSICGGGSATLTASGATTYTWNTGATTAGIVVSPGITTNYTVTGTNALGCSKAYTTQVFVGTSPTVAVNSSSVCSGSSTNLTASGAVTYSWNTGATTAGISVSPMATTVYTITGANGGCTDVKTSTVNVTASPSVIVNNSSICTGNSATLTATGAPTYSWSTGATSSAIVVSPTSNTSYTVTGDNGGCTDVQVSNVTVNTTPTVSVNSATICAGFSATLTASGASTYSWNTGATSNAIVVSPASTTTYTVDGNNGPCVDTQMPMVTVNAQPSVSLAVSSTTNCTSSTGGFSVALTGSPAGGVYSGTGVTGSTFNPPAGAGNYIINYSYTDPVTLCSNAAVSTISVNVCTGITQLPVSYSGNIYIVPNPNNGKFTINADIADEYDVNIYNNIGQLVHFSTQNKNTVNVDLSRYAKGIYSVVFKIKSDYKTVKVLIE